MTIMTTWARERCGGWQQLQPAVRWVTSLGVGAELRRFGVPAARITELDWTETAESYRGGAGHGVQITSLPSRHFSGRKHVQPV